MKLDLQSLSAEPLVYMLMHSGAFVTALGIIFFLIGLLFGRLTWGRYKAQSRALRAEAEAMKEELASLKRKLGDLSVKSGPAVPIVTEMIALPKKDKDSPAAPPVTAAAAPETKKSADNSPLPPASMPPPPVSAPAPGQSDRPAANVIKSRTPPEPESASNGILAPSAAPTPESASEAAAAPASTPSPSQPAHASVAIPMTPEAASAAASLASPLAAIITPAPKKELDPVLGKGMLMLPEIPLADSQQTSTAPKFIKPDFDFDPQLGLIYRTKPENSDDLTALRGVARALEQRLHALGVYTYEQIASWTQDQVREFSTRLAFKDRIEREQWVEQARELLAGQQQKKRQALASVA